MDRRGFLKLFGMAAAGLALEEAIPFGRVWSFPKDIKLVSSTIAANISEYSDFVSVSTLLTPAYYSRAALDILRQKCRFEPDPLYLPPRSGKTIKWRRYAPSI